MKRTAMHHTKLARLARALDVPKYAAVGILESLWHLTAREAFMGNIGKLPDEEIAAVIDWRGDASVLIGGLVRTGWLDQDDKHRLVVHDWLDHMDDAAKKALTRQLAKEEAKKSAPKPAPSQVTPVRAAEQVEVPKKEAVQTTADTVAFCPDSGGQNSPASALPLPEPLPEPEPGPEPLLFPAPKLQLRPLQRPATPAECELVYQAYPRHVGKIPALKAIADAVKRLGIGDHTPAMDVPEALVYLRERAQVFARSPAGKKGEYTPHPATWFGQGRYLDNDDEWSAGRDNRDRGQQNLDAALDALRIADERDRRASDAAREAEAQARGTGDREEGEPVGGWSAPVLEGTRGSVFR